MNIFFSLVKTTMNYGLKYFFYPLLNEQYCHMILMDDLVENQPTTSEGWYILPVPQMKLNPWFSLSASQH